MSDTPFAGQRVVVTGGGTGIGRATALAFANLGAESVLITGRRPHRLAEVAALHPAVVAVPADVTTAEGARAVAGAVGEHGGSVDVLVHNAGIYRFTPVGQLDVDVAREILDTNLVGPLQLTSALAPLLRSPGGNIVFVSSVAGHNPTPGASVYGASKAAVDSLVRTWALELGPKGIRVNAVAPAAVRTEVYSANGLSDEDIDAWFGYQASTTPLGRTGEVDDVTSWITRLAEPTSSWVTGQIITLDGGADLVRS
jgi:NAD(P)-dependent dehydrogenase (short-subunit alcohol dehydrogenase family)